MTSGWGIHSAHCKNCGDEFDLVDGGVQEFCSWECEDESER